MLLRNRMKKTYAIMLVLVTCASGVTLASAPATSQPAVVPQTKGQRLFSLLFDNKQPDTAASAWEVKNILERSDFRYLNDFTGQVTRQCPQVWRVLGNKPRALQAFLAHRMVQEWPSKCMVSALVDHPGIPQHSQESHLLHHLFFRKSLRLFDTIKQRAVDPRFNLGYVWKEPREDGAIVHHSAYLDAMQDDARESVESITLLKYMEVDLSSQARADVLNDIQKRLDHEHSHSCSHGCICSDRAPVERIVQILEAPTSRIHTFLTPAQQEEYRSIKMRREQAEMREQVGDQNKVVFLQNRQMGPQYAQALQQSRRRALEKHAAQKRLSEKERPAAAAFQETKDSN